MRCAYCNFSDTKVIDKRDLESDNTTRRRRECLSCAKRFTTYERIEQVCLIVVKKDGRREPFDRAKLIKGLSRAVEKRPVPHDTVQIIVDNIETSLRREDSVEIPSKKIGRLAMNKLKKLDKVAYIRFASVYKDFDDIDTFEKEIKKIKK